LLGVSELQAIARRIGADERTLRRAVDQGTVRALRPSPRKLEMPAEEERYLRRHWSLLSALRRALRTERSTRLAVLFGSVATGDASAASDIDLLVAGRGWEPLERVRLSSRLARIADRRVHLVSLDEALASPSLLADALEDGRVLVDRDHRWPELKGREEEVVRMARRAEELTASRARAAVGEARARLG
jgi:predicted nucleotidyltransferase